MLALALTLSWVAASARADNPPPVVRDICFPVSGDVSYTDTFGDPRGDHVHEGEDLMGSKLQPLLAAHDATVYALQYSSAGNYLFLKDAEGWQYWYIHINNDSPGTDDGANPWEWAFAPGMAVGATVHEGQFIAYMGDSGNAESTSPHLHFELHQPDGSWGGVPVNPYESLQQARTCSWVPSDYYAPFDNAEDFVAQQYHDFLNRDPDNAGLDYWSSVLSTQQLTPAQMVEVFLDSAEFGAQLAPVTRLYFAIYDRIPDADGLSYWIDQFQSGMSLVQIANAFVNAPEFEARYGSLDNSEFVDLVYENVMNRPADQAGHDYWVAKLDGGLARGDLMALFSQSAEYAKVSKVNVDVTMVYVGMLRRTPDQAGFDYWTSHSREDLIKGVLVSPEYAARFS